MKGGFNAKEIFSLLIAFAMVASLITPLGQGVKAAASASISPIYYYAPYDGTQNSGTPIAYFVTLSGATAGAQYYVNAYFYNGTNPSGAYIWNSTSSAWIPTTSSSPSSTSGHPIVTADASGNWSGWIFCEIKN